MVRSSTLLFCLALLPLASVAQDSLLLSSDSAVSVIDSLFEEDPPVDVLVADTLKATTQEEKVLQAPDLSSYFSVYKIFWAIVLVISGYLLINLLCRILGVFAERSTHNRIAIKSLIPVVRIVGWLLVIFLMIAGIFQPPAATLIALSASTGLAVGFASQDILKNIFGGIMILFDRPFQTGDKIEVSGHYGEVVEIGLRSTRIVTPDDNLVSIPNSEIMNKSVSNANAGHAHCQVVAEIYLPINTDTIKARSIATQAAMVSRFIYLNKPVAVVFSNEYRDRESVIKMKIKAYVADIRDEFRFKSDMTELALSKLLEEGMIAQPK